MANVAVRFSASLVDELGTNASTVAYGLVPDTVTLAGIKTSYQAWQSALDAIVGAAVTGGRIDFVQSGLTTDKGAGAGKPKAGSRVEQTGIVNFTNAVNSHRWGEAIPGLDDAVISGGKLDLANAAVIAFNAVLTGALAGGTYTNPYLQAIVAVKDALLSFRERRKQLQRSSGELG
jgi:hypothetical protein